MPLRDVPHRATVTVANLDPDADGRRACSGCSSSARSTCSGCCATTRSRSAWRSCRWRSASAALSLGFAARLIMRFGAAPTLLAGTGARGGRRCCCSAARRCTRSYLTDLCPAMVLLGVGAGLAFPSLMTLAMSGATPEDAGLASGLVNTTQQVGGALGLAVLATLSSHRTEDLLAQRRLGGVRADQRLPPGVHDRRRPGRDRSRTGRVRAALPTAQANEIMSFSETPELDEAA